MPFHLAKLQPRTFPRLQGERRKEEKQPEEEKEEERSCCSALPVMGGLGWCWLATEQLLLSSDTWAPGLPSPSGSNYLSQTEGCLLVAVKGFFSLSISH